MVQDDSEKLYTLSEVANHFQVSQRTIHRWLQSSELFGMFIARQWRFTEAAIKAKEKASTPTEGKGARKKRAYTRRSAS